MTQNQKLIGRAIKIAKDHAKLKHGEEGGNNIGKWVYHFRKTDGTGRRVGGKGDWCAAFASSCIVQAARDMRILLPFRTSRGARRLVRNAEPEGKRLIGRDIECAKWGGLISWKRRYKGKWHPWKGHVALWHGYDRVTDTLYTVEGNNRKRGERLAYVRLVEYPNGSWRKRLDRIVGF